VRGKTCAVSNVYGAMK